MKVKDARELEELILNRGAHLDIVFKEVDIKQQKRSEAIGTHEKLGREGGFYISMEKPTWIAYGEGNKSGNWFTYLRDNRGFSYPEYLSYLAQAAGVEIKQQDQQQQSRYEQAHRRGSLLEEAHSFFKDALGASEGAQVRSYLEARGYTHA